MRRGHRSQDGRRRAHGRDRRRPRRVASRAGPSRRGPAAPVGDRHPGRSGRAPAPALHRPLRRRARRRGLDPRPLRGDGARRPGLRPRRLGPEVRHRRADLRDQGAAAGRARAAGDDRLERDPRRGNRRVRRLGLPRGPRHHRARHDRLLRDHRVHGPGHDLPRPPGHAVAGVGDPRTAGARLHPHGGGERDRQDGRPDHRRARRHPARPRRGLGLPGRSARLPAQHVHGHDAPGGNQGQHGARVVSGRGRLAADPRAERYRRPGVARGPLPPPLAGGPGLRVRRAHDHGGGTDPGAGRHGAGEGLPDGRAGRCSG